MRTFLFVCGLVLALVVSAEDKAIVVLDASGSMWGQIDGQPKITLAKDVFTDLIEDWDQSVALGVTVYGHRSKGDCNDIESVYPVSALDGPRLQQIIQGISPKGKTPLARAVKQAAEELKFTEDKATVILISDGKESCDADPCAMAGELEKLGVDFTAHVIGFDVDAETQAELRCMAETTGGHYYDADGAAELGEALKQVTRFPETIGFHAVAEDGTNLDGLSFSYVFSAQQGGQSFRATGSGRETRVRFDVAGVQGLSPGLWDVEAQSGFFKASSSVQITETENQMHEVVFTNTRPTIHLTAPEQAVKSTEIEVSWDNKDVKEGRIILVKPDAGFEAYGISHVYLNEVGSAQLLMPAEIGTYELRIISKNETLTTQAIEVVDTALSILAPKRVVAGTVLSVSVNGPKDIKGQIVLDKPDSKVKPYGEAYAYVNPDKESFSIQLPVATGDYVLRWISQKNELLTEKGIELYEEGVTLTLEENIRGGALFTVKTTGPEGVKGQVVIDDLNSAPRPYGLNHAYVKDAAEQTFELIAPVEPGQYVVRRLGVKNELIKQVEVNVVEAGADFKAPQMAIVGTEISLETADFAVFGGSVILDKPEQKPRPYGLMHNYVKAAQTPLRMIATPGVYELRWLNRKNGLVASQQIQLAAPEIKLTISENIKAGETFTVAIQATSDLVGSLVVQKASDKPSPYGLVSAYIRENAAYEVVEIKAPEVAGEYELRWITQKQAVLHRQSITVR
ncbi:VWA domain-containing protein [Marinicella sp. W31]|uniref:vWA domain-containing protein n=1 Tax=Marinicella sp. W31 TaxID=3023713 RepID=UPI003756F046